LPIDIILNFLEFAGIPVIMKPIAGTTFLPGLQLENGRLVIDTEKLLYPGDILHEAGHIATTHPDIRKTLNDNLPDNDENRGGEIMAIAWSYAACIYLKLDTRVVFHEHGYKSGGDTIIENFSAGKYLGVPMLQWTGMAYDKQKAKEFNAVPYPHMLRWLREA